MASKLHLFVIALTCFALLIAPVAASGYDSGDVTNAENITEAEAKAQSSEIVINLIKVVVPESTAGKVIGGTELSGVVAVNGFKIYANAAYEAAITSFHDFGLDRFSSGYVSKAVSRGALKSAHFTAKAASQMANAVNHIAGYGALLYYGYRYCDKSADLIQDAYVQHGVEFDHTLLNW